MLFYSSTFIYAHKSTRYQNTKDYRVSETSAQSRTDYFGSIGACATFCNQLNTECESFSSLYMDKDSSGSDNFRGYKCEFLYSNYTGYKTSASGWNLWEKKTSTSGARSVTSTSADVLDSCPTVWRKWSTTGSVTEMSSVDDGSDSANAIDDDNTTSATTRDGSSSGHSFPFFLLDIGRNIRLTKVSFLGGDSPQDNPIMNVDIRFGSNSNSGFNPNSKITNNERCGTYFGPALVQSQWIEINCGFKDGLHGRYLSLQLLERFSQPDEKFEIKEIEVYGWGKTCLTDVA